MRTETDHVGAQFAMKPQFEDQVFSLRDSTSRLWWFVMIDGDTLPTPHEYPNDAVDALNAERKLRDDYAARVKRAAAKIGRTLEATNDTTWREDPIVQMLAVEAVCDENAGKVRADRPYEQVVREALDAERRR